MGVARIGESAPADSGQRDAKRLDRNLIELLNELRVTGTGQRPYIVRTANTLAISGMAFLAVGLVAILVLLSHVVFGSAAALVVGPLSAAVIASLWFVLPISRR